MAENPIFHVRPGIAVDAHVNADRFRLMTSQATTNPDAFWAGEARRVDWMRPAPRSSRTPVSRAMSRSNGSRTAPSTSPPTVSTAT